MITATDSSNHTSTFSYDGDSHRVKRNISNTETWQVYGLGGGLIAEYAKNESYLNPQKEYGYRNDQLSVSATITTGWGSAPTIHDNPLVANQTTVQALHITEVRYAINALGSHMSLTPFSWQYSATTNDYISANPILEMRIALDQALGPPPVGYAAGLAHDQPVMRIHIQELRDRVLAAWQSGTGVDLRWMVTDQLGTPRMIFDQSGDLANVSRHDYLPFGEELFSGTRTTALGYTNGDGARQKFTQKERDNETGLDFFQARYYSSSQGRFTSVDPVILKKARWFDPQRLNLYTYGRNNPLKYVDPTGEDITITVTNVVVGTSTVRTHTASEIRQAESKGQQLNVKTETVNTYKVIVTNETGQTRVFVVTRDTNRNGSVADMRGNYGTGNEAPPGQFKGHTREDGSKGFRIEVYDPNVTQSSPGAQDTLHSPDGTARQNVQVHIGPGCSEGCMLLTGGTAGRDNFQNTINEMRRADRENGWGDAINVNIQARNAQDGNGARDVSENDTNPGVGDSDPPDAR